MSALGTIQAMRSWETADKLKQRERLHSYLLASARLGRRARSERAKGRWMAINETAAAYLWASASTDNLKDIADALTREALAAQAFERIEGPNA